MIFDSAVVSGNDFHLGSPNAACPGCTPNTCRGWGSGGAPFQPGKNCIPLDKCLIISEDCNSADPDDNAAGGILLIEACTPFYLQAAVVLNAPAGSYLKFFDQHGNQCPHVYQLPVPMHHVNARIDIGPVTVFNDLYSEFDVPTDDYTLAHCSGYPVSRVAIHLAGSGCIDNLDLRLPEVTRTECTDHCPGVCCSEQDNNTCVDDATECVNGTHLAVDGSCAVETADGFCGDVCCVYNDRVINSSLVQSVADCILAGGSTTDIALAQCNVTLGACCSHTTQSCVDGTTSDACVGDGGTFFERMYCGDQEVDACRLGQCCVVAPNDEFVDRRRNAKRSEREQKRAACVKRGLEDNCPCLDVVCPSEEYELPCSREGFCRLKSGWGWYAEYECRFGTGYGDICATTNQCTAQGNPCQCDACFCSTSNKGIGAQQCTVPTTVGTTVPVPTCPQATNDCTPNVLRPECPGDDEQFAVWTPYTETEDTTQCSPNAPCHMSCCGTQCYISATTLAVEGGTLIRYFFDGCDGMQSISIGSDNCGDVDGLKCKFIAPRPSEFFELSSAGSALDASSSSSGSESSSLSSIGDDASQPSAVSLTSAKHKCTISTTCSGGIGLAINSAFHGVELFVPETSSVGPVAISVVADAQCQDCGIQGPGVQCSLHAALRGHRRPGAVVAPAPNVPVRHCIEPPMPALTMSEAQQRAAATAWGDLADERLSAFLDCVHEPFGIGAKQAKLHVPSDGTCDYARCLTRLHGGGSGGTHAEAALRIMLDGDRQLAFTRYADAAQAYCCVEFIVERLGAAHECSDAQTASRCATTVVHPVASPSRGRPTLLDAAAIRDTDANGRPQLAVLAFEQCKLTKFTPEDNDINDGVFEVSATSHVADDTLLDYSLLVRPLAFGSIDDAALDVRFADVGIPQGSRVYVSNVGAEAHTACYTANSVADESVDCPSMAVARLFHSLRGAFASSTRVRANAPINTQINLPHVDASHLALMVVVPPRRTRAAVAVDIRLDFELVFRSEEHICTVHSNGVAKNGASGYAVLVPAPFRVPREGIPAYLESPSGICVGGDDAGDMCTTAQECPHGYCDTDRKSRSYLKCVDTRRAGVDESSTCTRPSQCAYGVCYGYQGSGRRGAYPVLRDWLECVGVGCYGASAAHIPWCLQSACFGDTLEWSARPDVESAADDLYPAQQ